MTKETHRIRVVLKSGVVLESRESLREDEDQAILEEIFEDRTSTWKDVGDITFRFGDLAAIQIEEL